MLPFIQHVCTHSLNIRTDILPLFEECHMDMKRVSTWHTRTTIVYLLFFSKGGDRNLIKGVMSESTKGIQCWSYDLTSVGIYI